MVFLLFCSLQMPASRWRSASDPKRSAAAAAASQSRRPSQQPSDQPSVALHQLVGGIISVSVVKIRKGTHARTNIFFCLLAASAAQTGDDPESLAESVQQNFAHLKDKLKKRLQQLDSSDLFSEQTRDKAAAITERLRTVHRSIQQQQWESADDALWQAGLDLEALKQQMKQEASA